MPCVRVCLGRPVPPGLPTCPDCSGPENVIPEAARRVWEKWDLRILVLYIFITQIYLLVFGRLRRRSRPRTILSLNAWLLYLFAELFATIALGRLSNVKCPNEEHKLPPRGLRGLWAPIILFYLGGPDTITVLHLEENHMWVRHLIALLTLGARTAYVMYATWTTSPICFVAMLMLVSGVIKYGERVWIIRSRALGNLEGFIQLDDDLYHEIQNKMNNNTIPPSAKLVLQAYSCFQILKPHTPSSSCDATKVGDLIRDFQERATSTSAVHDPFQLIEIELGFTYDVLFSKMDRIFTVWGCISRFITFTCVVSVLVGFHMIENSVHLGGDFWITIILLSGAIFLEIAGIFVQLISDWGVVWAYQPPITKNQSEAPNRQPSDSIIVQLPIQRPPQLMSDSQSQHSSDPPTHHDLSEPSSTQNPSDDLPSKPDAASLIFRLNSLLIQYPFRNPFKLVSIIFYLHKLLISKRKRWSELMGQFNLLNYWTSRNELTKLEEMIQAVCGKERMLHMKFKLDLCPVQPNLKRLIMDHLRDRSQNISESTEMGRGQWTLGKNNCSPVFEWSIKDLEFNESIAIWHIATDICFHLEDDHKLGTKNEQVQSSKQLSHYMMHLLFICPHRFPISKANDKLKQVHDDVHNFFPKGGSEWSNVEWNQLLEKECDPSNITVNNIQKLARDLRNQKHDRWKIVSNVWVEMLCYAASHCPLKNHVQELRNGGELLTHVWLLLMHFGFTKKQQENIAPPNLGDSLGSGIKEGGTTTEDLTS